MDPTIRGLIEQFLDSQLTDEKLYSSFNLFKSFKDGNAIDSIESAMISQIYTSITMAFNLTHLGKEFREQDTEELVKLFLSRSEFIKTRIRKVCNI